MHCDVNYLSNRERIAFIRGSNLANQGYPAQYDTVEDAANILVNEDFVNNIVETAVDVINNELPDAIDKVLPYSETIPIDGILFVTGATATVHDFDIGHIALGPTFLRDNDRIVATDVVIENIYLDGQVDIHDWFGVTFTVPFRVRGNVENIVLDEFMMKLIYNDATNDIELQFDTDDLDAEFFNQLNIEVDIVGLPWWLDNIFSWVVNIIKDLVGYVMRALFDIITIPLLDVDDLSMSVNLDDLGIGLSGVEIGGAV